MNQLQKGHLHLMSQAIREIADIFARFGFAVADGPELEDEWHNFDALNIPKDHPARDMQDTFWLKGKERRVLRTHTSSVQIRYMEEKVKRGIKPPYRIIVPGKVFRNEATDATHEAQFHQVEGLFVDKGVSMAHLKWTLLHFFREFFDDEKVEVRFRPSFFPFTEPSVEVDMLRRPRGSESRPPTRGGVGASGRWLEMGGAGLVHPTVLENVGLSSKKYRGFAFGVGIDRLLMLRHGIPDIRMFYNGDLRVVNQF